MCVYIYAIHNFRNYSFSLIKFSFVSLPVSTSSFHIGGWKISTSWQHFTTLSLIIFYIIYWKGSDTQYALFCAIKRDRRRVSPRSATAATASAIICIGGNKLVNRHSSPLIRLLVIQNKRHPNWCDASEQCIIYSSTWKREKKERDKIICI